MAIGKSTKIILIITALAVLGAALILLWRPSAGEAKEVLVTVDGEAYGRYPLDIDRDFTVETPWGYNQVIIHDGQAEVHEADCPNQICVNTASASEIGDMIVCLPHRLVVEIVPEDSP